MTQSDTLRIYATIIQFIIIFFLAGFIWSYVYTHSNPTQFLKHSYENCKISGKILHIEEFEKRNRITLKNSKYPSFLKLSVPKKMDIKIHDEICGKADLIPPGNPPTPYSFDVRKDCYFKNISGFGRMRWLKKISLNIDNSSNFFTQAISKVSVYFQKQLRTHIKNSKVYSIAKAIVLGDKFSINQNIKDCFSMAGISHLLAISGLHLMLFSGIIFFIIRLIFCCIPLAHQYDSKKIAAVVALFFAMLYMAISGFGYPVVRATIMFGFLMLSILLDRTALSMRSVAFAAMVIMIFKPNSIISISFILSFGAVIALVAFFESIPYWRFGFLFSMTSTTLIASLVTLPICAITFHSITLLSLLGNIIAIPFFTYIVMPLGMLSLMVHSFFFQYWEKSIELLIRFAEEISKLPFGKIYILPTSNEWSTFFFVMGVFWLCIWQTKWRVLGILLIVFGVFSYTQTSKPDIFWEPSKKIMAIRDGDILYAPQLRKGKYYLEEWAKVYGLTLIKDKDCTRFVFPDDADGTKCHSREIESPRNGIYTVIPKRNRIWYR